MTDIKLNRQNTKDLERTKSYEVGFGKLLLSLNEAANPILNQLIDAKTLVYQIDREDMMIIKMAIKKLAMKIVRKR